jgi:hypothetical protein
MQNYSSKNQYSPKWVKTAVGLVSVKKISFCKLVLKENSSTVRRFIEASFEELSEQNKIFSWRIQGGSLVQPLLSKVE